MFPQETILPSSLVSSCVPGLLSLVNSHTGLPTVPPPGQAPSHSRALCPHCPCLKRSAPRSWVSSRLSDLSSSSFSTNSSSLDSWFSWSPRLPPAPHVPSHHAVLVLASHVSPSKLLFVYLFVICLHPQEPKYQED